VEEEATGGFGFVGDGGEVGEGDGALVTSNPTLGPSPRGRGDVTDLEVQVFEVFSRAEVSGEADGVLVVAVGQQEAAELYVGGAEEVGQVGFRFAQCPQRALFRADDDAWRCLAGEVREGYFVELFEAAAEDVLS
jgi:hypothetical protein